MTPAETEDYCTCGALQEAAEEPDVPVAFEPATGEFHLLYGPGGGGRYVIAHCFRCGGRAPETLRPRLFARLTWAERERLMAQTGDLRTVRETLAALGAPDEDLAAGTATVYPERAGRPEVTRFCRLWRYRGLSELANVEVTVQAGGAVSFAFVGKYIGKSRHLPEVP